MNYKFQLESFEGPLDLLLYLIKKEEISIYDIPIAEITEQYLQYIEMMKLLDLDGIGDFLVMAATLLQIKSRMLLPPDPTQPEEVLDPRADLVRRLEEYQRIKEAAEQLRLRMEQRQDLFARKIETGSLEELKEDAKEVYFEANLFDLVTSLTKALRDKPDKGHYEVRCEEYTVEDKITLIQHLLIERPRMLLTEIFEQAHDKMEVIVTFMAVLELCRQKQILVVQKRLFSEIELLKNTENIVVLPREQAVAQETVAPSALTRAEDDPKTDENSAQTN
jgi:segregation and condensation protein A